MDADSQARQLFDRMAVDFAQMVKRSDVSYYLKNQANPQTGNDQIAFYTSGPGYYPSDSYQSPISVVAYRVNPDPTPAPAASPYSRVERMGTGLLWNGYTGSWPSMVFVDPPAYTQTISAQWPGAISNSGNDSAYEVFGPQIFRLEYYYLLTTGILSTGPWIDTNAVAIKDVAAIVVAIAVIDPKSKVLLSSAQIKTLAGKLPDYDPSIVAGQFLPKWQAILDNTIAPDAQITAMPRPAISGVRLYERYFYLAATPQ